MGAALATLASIVLSLGLSKVGSLIDEYRSSKKKMSVADVTAVIDKMAAEARTKGSKIYNELTNKLSAISNPIIQSASVKSIVQDRRRELNDKIKTVSENLTKVENELQPLSQKANAMSYMSDSFRSSKTGRRALESITNEAQHSINSINKILEGVEQNV